MAKKNVAK